MKLSTIQVYEQTKKQLAKKKVHPRESYDSVLQRMLQQEQLPSLQEVFELGDAIKQKKQYSTREIVAMSHELRKHR